MRERHGFLDGLDISIDEVDIPLFLNTLNVLVKSMFICYLLVLLSLLGDLGQGRDLNSAPGSKTGLKD